jgi:hypothetical protein
LKIQSSYSFVLKLAFPIQFIKISIFIFLLHFNLNFPKFFLAPPSPNLLFCSIHKFFIFLFLILNDLNNLILAISKSMSLLLNLICQLIYFLLLAFYHLAFFFILDLQFCVELIVFLEGVVEFLYLGFFEWLEMVL